MATVRLVRLVRGRFRPVRLAARYHEIDDPGGLSEVVLAPSYALLPMWYGRFESSWTKNSSEFFGEERQTRYLMRVFCKQWYLLACQSREAGAAEDAVAERSFNLETASAQKCLNPLSA